MANLRTDSPISRRIVSAFLNFIDSVEPAPGVDIEGLEIAKDCLAEVFKPRELPESERPKPNLLVNIFSSLGSTQSEATTNHSEELQDRPSTCNDTDVGLSEASKVQDAVEVGKDSETEESKDELFGHFFDALERNRFFSTTPNDDDNAFLDRATNLFHEAVNEIVESGRRTLDVKSLADALKTLGNNAMQSKLYADAIERYTCAISLCGNNAVYYCNRAAAYTQMHEYNEAIKDCLKSIEIDPNYSKAYSRLGLAYYAQGSYSDAINKGYRKALELDPNNDVVKENIRVAEQKLKEEQEQTRRQQETRNQGAPPFGRFENGTFSVSLADVLSHAEATGGAQSRSPFTSNPTHIASMFMNIGGNAFPGQNPGSGSEEQNNGSEPSSMPFDASALPGMFMNIAGESEGGTRINIGGSDETGISGANISMNFAEQTPEDLTETLRTVMGMFNGGAPPRDPPQDGESRNTQ